MWSLVVLACGAAPPPHLAADEGLQRVLAASRAGRHVGLGEVEHGSGAIAEQRAEWTRALLEDGARVLAIEAPWSGGQRIQAWLDGDCAGETPVEVTLNVGHPAWADVSTAELLAWICVHNREQPSGPVRVVGFDDQDLEAVEWVAGQLGMPVPDLSAACLERPGDPACAEVLSDPAVPEAARIVITALAEQLAASGRRRMEVRDRAMAELLRLQLPDPDERAVVWAHDNHLNEASDRTQVCRRAYGFMLCRSSTFRSMGTLLADDLDVLSVSMSSSELELWSKSGEPTRWSPAVGAAERRLPERAYVPLDEPWSGTLGQVRGDLSLAFDAIAMVPAGRGLLPSHTLEPLGEGKPVTWVTGLDPASAEAVIDRALARSPWTGAVTARQERGWTWVTVVP